MPAVTCRFSDGGSFIVEGEVGQNFLEVALSQGVPIRNQCRSGSCLTCLCGTESGSEPLILRRGQVTSLLKSDRELGKALCCVSELMSDGELYFDYPSDETGPSEVQSFIDSVEWIASDAVKLSVELADGAWLDFEPGQYVEISVPSSEECRSYSMCSAPEDLPRLEFMIRILEDGSMSNYLSEFAKVDDVLKLRGPFGKFVWSGSRASPHLFIAGGTGLSPICSMLQHIRSVSGKKPQMTLSLSCANPDAMLDLDFLKLLEAWMPTLDLKLSVREENTGAFLTGNALTPIDFESLSPDTEAYVCGPDGLIKAATEKLLAAGVRPENIFYEQFVATGNT